jgi:hypothetical protein
MEELLIVVRETYKSSAKYSPRGDKTEPTRDGGIRRNIILDRLFPIQSLLTVDHIPNQNTAALLDVSYALLRQRAQVGEVDLWY